MNEAAARNFSDGAAAKELGAVETAHGAAANEIRASRAATNGAAGNALATSCAANVVAADGINGHHGVSLGAPAFSSVPIVANQRRSLLEPGAALMAIARPFLNACSTYLRLMQPQKKGIDANEPVDSVAAENGGLVERSFASEVASLLRAPLELDASRVQLPNAEDFAAAQLSITGCSAPEFHPSATDIEPSQPPSASPIPREQPLNTTASGIAQLPIANDKAELQHSRTRETADARYPTLLDISDSRNVETHEVADSHHTALAETGRSQRAIAGEITDADISGTNESVDSQFSRQHNVVVASFRAHRGERAVPLTRLPLRPQGLAISWTAELVEFETSGPPSRAQRHDVLERLIRDPGRVPSEVVARAYEEEDGEGRAIALRVLLRNFPQAGRSAFREALRVGSDEERAIAVDGLTAIGAREELAPAFGDRVDAIAARAALAYVGTLKRADYTVALSTFIDGRQIETILKLLAGIVE